MDGKLLLLFFVSSLLLLMLFYLFLEIEFLKEIKTKIIKLLKLEIQLLLDLLKMKMMKKNKENIVLQVLKKNKYVNLTLPFINLFK
jgi:hypothetical protein